MATGSRPSQPCSAAGWAAAAPAPPAAGAPAAAAPAASVTRTSGEKLEWSSSPPQPAACGRCCANFGQIAMPRLPNMHGSDFADPNATGNRFLRKFPHGRCTVPPLSRLFCSTVLPLLRRIRLSPVLQPAAAAKPVLGSVAWLPPGPQWRVLRLHRCPGSPRSPCIPKIKHAQPCRCHQQTMVTRTGG